MKEVLRRERKSEEVMCGESGESTRREDVVGARKRQVGDRETGITWTEVVYGQRRL